MAVEICMASRNHPLRSLLQRALKNKGHRFSEATNPVECIQLFTPGTREDCRVMIADYTGPETFEMLDVAIERAHIRSENIAVLSLPSAYEAEEAAEYGCRLMESSFKLEKISNWVTSSAKRCVERGR